MERFVLLIGVILIVLWLLGYFAFHLTSPFIHLLIVIGLLLMILGVVRKRENQW
jgi:hypothetical protein